MSEENLDEFYKRAAAEIQLELDKQILRCLNWSSMIPWKKIYYEFSFLREKLTFIGRKAKEGFSHFEVFRMHLRRKPVSYGHASQPLL